jgi:Ca2+-binding EF-hand superfamily protein
VDGRDFVKVLLHFGKKWGWTRYDVNSDGRVNFKDLLVVLRCAGARGDDDDE